MSRAGVREYRYMWASADGNAKGWRRVVAEDFSAAEAAATSDCPAGMSVAFVEAVAIAASGAFDAHDSNGGAQ